MYAIELNGAHVGCVMGSVKKYRYGGKEKTKVNMYEIKTVQHDEIQTRIKGYELNEDGHRKSYYIAWYPLKWDQEVTIVVPTAKGKGRK